MATSPEEKAYKLGLEHRLRHEGRWSVASEYKDAQLRAFRQAGEELELASLHAWQAMEREYPAFTEEELKAAQEERLRKQKEGARRAGKSSAISRRHAEAVADPGQQESSNPATVAAGDATAPRETKVEVPRPRRHRKRWFVKIPAEWGNLPANATPEADAQWVQANLVLCRERALGDKDRLRLRLAAEPAPSRCAVSLMEQAIGMSPANWAGLYVKMIGKGDDDPNQVKRRERASIEEIKGILTQLKEG